MVATLVPVEDRRALTDLGLRYSHDGQPGITRRKRGTAMSYAGPDGKPAAAEIARVKQLAIPPAWTDVWICVDSTGHLQATGRDARGRKQYRYHDDWSEFRNLAKFERLAEFGDGLTSLRQRLDSDLAQRGLGHERVVALAVTLLDRTLIRVGNPEYRRTNNSYGLTTLRWNHVGLDASSLTFRFRGKGGVDHDIRLSDKRLSRLVSRCHELGGKDVFTYLDADGEPRAVSSTDCNAYLRSVIGDQFSVKDFRTWGATTAVVQFLATGEPPPLQDRHVLAAVDNAAMLLGNTRAVCRRSYIHPAIIEKSLDGELHDVWKAARPTTQLDRSEKATLRILQD